MVRARRAGRTLTPRPRTHRDPITTHLRAPQAQGVRSPALALRAQVASISRVPPKSYRKLARKEGLELPLLSDAGAEWLGALGAGAASAPLTALVLGLPAATVLGSFRAEEGESAAALVARVAAAVPSAEATAAAAIEAAAAASAAATLAAENEAMRRQLAELGYAPGWHVAVGPAAA